MNQSISTIAAPEFINLQPMDINPLISACEIKVLYLGSNRNHTHISKDVAVKMAKTLRGSPIVGYFKNDKADFDEHNKQITVDSEGLHIRPLTVPYGFVAPDAQVWFKDFEEEDSNGQKVTRTYLMTTGYLWTGQYEECADVVNNNRPQSMELDDKTLQGEWTKDSKSSMEFFIINDAIFTKLCILGNDVEPCFEGAAVTKPTISTNFSYSQNFVNTLYTMMQDLQTTLKGGTHAMENNEVKLNNVDTTIAPVVSQGNSNENVTPEIQSSIDTFKKTDDPKEKDKDDKEKNTAPASGSANDEKDKDNSSNSSSQENDEDDKKKKKTNFSLDELTEKYQELEKQYSQIMASYTALKNDYANLTQFKDAIDTEKKDALINEFYMLSDEDKADVIANKSKYSLDEIEAKLAVICRRKKVNFSVEKITNEPAAAAQEPQTTPVVTFNYNQTENVPAFISALRNTKQINNLN